MSCRMPDDDPAGLDKVLREPEAEGRVLREQEVPSVLMSLGARGWGGVVMSKCWYSSPQSWLAGTLHLMAPTLTAGRLHARVVSCHQMDLTILRKAISC